MSTRSHLLTAGLLNVTIALLAVLGLATAIVLVPLMLQGWDGFFSIIDAARQISSSRDGGSMSATEEAYAGNILSVVIISLTAVSLLAAIITVASILGLNAHAKMLRHEIRDDITESAYDVVRDMTHISAETQRAQSALDLSAHEWLARAGWMSDDSERPRALIRAWTHAEDGLREVANARKRLHELDRQNRDLESVRKRIAEVSAWLRWIEINVINTRLFYLASLYAEGVLDDEEKVRRGILPEKKKVRADCKRGVSQLETYYEEQRDDELGFYCYKFRETVIYVRDRLKLRPEEQIRADLEQLLADIDNSTVEDPETRTKWIADRRSDYAHLFE